MALCTRTLCSTFGLTYFTDDNTIYNLPHIRKQLGISSAKQLIFGNGKATKYTQNNNTKAAQCSLTIQLVLIAIITAMVITILNRISTAIHTKKCKTEQNRVQNVTHTILDVKRQTATQ